MLIEVYNSYITSYIFQEQELQSKENEKSKRNNSKVKSFWVIQLYIKCKAFYTWKAVTRYRRFHTNKKNPVG